MEFIDDAEFQIAIDNDNGARITSLKWRDNEFAVPFRGQVHTSGWYAMAPWAGRINEGLIKYLSKSKRRRIAKTKNIRHDMSLQVAVSILFGHMD